MADIAASDVTYTQQRRVVLRDGFKGLAYTKTKVVFGNGTLTYPTGGVPLTKGALGCPGQIDALILTDEDDGNGIVWKWDSENNKLRAYVQGVAVSAAGAVTMDDFPVNTATDPLAQSGLSVSLHNSAGAGTHRWGQLKEVINTYALPAQTLYVLTFGW